MATEADRIDANLCAIEDDLRWLASNRPNRDSFELIVAMQERANDLFDQARKQIVEARANAVFAESERSIKFYMEIAGV